MMNWNDLLNDERPSGKKFEENASLNISPFERDYFTIVESSYFRRLQRKTQVYTLDDNDFVRTRLTHSMEVSGIAELLGKKIAEKITEREGAESVPENFADKLPLVLRCAGLIHDFGNPPFGHSGEKYIRKYFDNREDDLRRDLPDKMWNDLISFDGNAQTLRIITKLGKSSNPNSVGYGMDLTNAVINSIIKYPWNSLNDERINRDAKGNIKSIKIGFYHSEEWIIKRDSGVGVAQKTGTIIVNGDSEKMLKNPIMLILEAADDIAYGTADIEDAIKTNRIDRREFYSIVVPNNVSSEKDDDLRREIMAERENSIEHVVNQFMENYDDIMNGNYKGELIAATENSSECHIEQLKGLVSKLYGERDESNEYLYQARPKMEYILDKLTGIILEDEDDRSIEEIFILKELGQYTDKGKKEVESIKANLKLNDEELAQEELYHNYLAIVDFLSGMTDSYVNIFSDRLHSDYYKTKEEDYKKDCLIEYSYVRNYDDCNNVLKKMAKVSTWTEDEKKIILFHYLKNNQISGSLEGNHHQDDVEKLKDIAREYYADHYEEQVNAFSGNEWLKIQNLFSN